jgi:phosphoadenosine phosphosulfate reductase
MPNPFNVLSESSSGSADLLLDPLTSVAELEDQTPAEILAWAAETFAPRVTLGTAFGVEGCVLIHMIAQQRLPISFFTLDTGLLFPETRELWHRLEEKYGVTIRPIRPAQTVEEQAVRWGPELWAREPDKCCHLRKVEPLRYALEGMDAWVTGIRREQTAERADTPVVERNSRFGVLKINPLVRWTHKDVWRYVIAHDVPYNTLHDRGYPSIGCWPCTSAVLEGEDPRSGRWRGHPKRECGLHAQSA